MYKEQTVCIHVYGIVQGVGFRPTVSRHAKKNHIKGSVCNMGPYVEIWAQGRKEDIDKFCDDIRYCPPDRAVILKMTVDEMSHQKKGEFHTFSIIESGKKKGDIFVSPDIAICPKCKKELYDPKNRRYLHPFINCTCCGPRLTILDSMPYDRERTSMAEFPMCEECEWEYTHPETRRYDAQPVCCNDCGPKVYILGQNVIGNDAVRLVRKVIKDGGIAAIKGIGGFHLCCDAANEETVDKLRKRKNRPVKPFAVMMRDLEIVKRECKVEKAQEELLDGYQKPILLLERKEDGQICPSVAPGNPKIGVMLPYAPIHLLLFDYKDDMELPDCLVMTSANTSGAPICRDDTDAERELTGLCDVILSNDRLIRIRADDTVLDFFRGEPYMIRRSRGFAPLPFMMNEEWQGEVLSMGGELKNTFCVGKNNLFYPSPYIGDMGDMRTVRALEESIGRLTGLLETKPVIVACDMHPGYNTTEAAGQMGLPVLKVQHHYAHILSCMAENDWKEPVIGVAFDGTGYGTDGTVWGGEFLLADYDGFVRWGSLRPFYQTGGDLAAREGWRVAVSLLQEIYGEQETMELVKDWKLCAKEEAAVLIKMSQRNINTVISTSAGRIFDAVSAILGICRHSTFEGEASISLEFAAEAFEKQKLDDQGEKAEGTMQSEKLKSMFEAFEKASRLAGREQEHKWADVFFAHPEEERQFIADTHCLIRQIVEEKKQKTDAGLLSYFFHKALAGMIAKACVCIRKDTGVNTAALSGGVYQNQLLLKLSVDQLEKENFHVLTHHLIPPNDGGICLGQAVAAMRKINR